MNSGITARFRGWTALCPLMAVALAVLALLTSAGAMAQSPASSVDRFVAEQMPRSGAPGLAYVSVDHGRMTGKGYGVALKGSDQPVTPDTSFLLGSISKSFTAVAVMQLVEAGKVNLDAGIGTYLKPFAGKTAGRITIRQLLSHTSGYSTVQGNSGHGHAEQGKESLSQRVERIAAWQPAYPANSRWEYSNANYLVLGRLVEVMSGQGYASYIAQHILKPIGMSRSYVSDGKVHRDMARGHVPWFWTKSALPEGPTDAASAPAGGIISTARDVARYLAVMINGRDDILSADSKAEMFRPASKMSPHYGFGWFLDADDGSVFHTGLTPGVETLAAMVPAKQQAVVVLANASSGIGFGQVMPLLTGVAERALAMPVTRPGDDWVQKSLYIGMALLPVIFVICMIVAWFGRSGLRAKRAGAFGLFSLWFPLFVTLGASILFYVLFPEFFGVSLATLRIFVPDFALILEASAVTGVAWALLRLMLAYGIRKGMTE